MKVKTISVNYERKLNLGNYQSATVGVALWADLDEGEVAEEAATQLQEKARALVKAEASRLVPELRTRTGVED